jgi:hypothetical protein
MTMTLIAQPQFVNPAPVRRHIQQLMRGHMTAEEIAQRAGIVVGLIDRLATGAGVGDAMLPINRTIAEAVMRVETDEVTSTPPGYVLARGTRRRIEALGAIGWSFTALAPMLGVTEISIEAILGSLVIPEEKANAVAALYERLCMTPAPDTTDEEHVLKVCAIARAKVEGWASELGWDDIDEDDEPTIAPRPRRTYVDEVAVRLAMEGTHVDLNRKELRTAILRLRDLGETDKEIRKRLHCSKSSVWRAEAKRQAPAKDGDES